MNIDNRNQRLRQLIKKLNSQRKKQAIQIDILCNDLVAAQRNFIEKLKTSLFAATFYESIIGVTEIGQLLSSADQLIKRELPDTNITFFIRNADNFEIYQYNENQPEISYRKMLDNFFKPELLESICSSNRVWTTQDITDFSVYNSHVELSKILITAIPLRTSGFSAGFILLCRPAQNPLTAEQVNKVSAVNSGLSAAISTCFMPLRSSD